MKLAGADFLVRFGRGDSFSGRVEPDRVIFELEREDPYYYNFYYNAPFSGSIVELLTPTLVFRPSGTAVISGTPSGLSGTLDGAIETFQSPDFGLVASCSSGAHRFVLSR